MEKHCNEAKQAYGYTRLQYEKEKNSPEEIEEQFKSERIAHEKTKAEFGGRVDDEKYRKFISVWLPYDHEYIFDINILCQLLIDIFQLQWTFREMSSTSVVPKIAPN